MQIVSAEEVGFSSQRLGRVDQMAQGYVDGGKLAGAITLLARGGKTFHHESYGSADLDSGAPMHLDSLIRIYSMTKPITSVAAMMLWEEGRFQLDDPVSRYIPKLGRMKVYQENGNGSGSASVEPDRPMTIRDLLTHTSGLTYGQWLRDESEVDRMYHDADLLHRDQTLEEMVEKFIRTAPGIPTGDAVVLQRRHRHCGPPGRSHIRHALRRVPASDDL